MKCQKCENKNLFLPGWNLGIATSVGVVYNSIECLVKPLPEYNCGSSSERIMQTNINTIYIPQAAAASHAGVILCSASLVNSTYTKSCNIFLFPYLLPICHLFFSQQKFTDNCSSQKNCNFVSFCSGGVEKKSC